MEGITHNISTNTTSAVATRLHDVRSYQLLTSRVLTAIGLVTFLLTVGSVVGITLQADSASPALIGLAYFSGALFAIWFLALLFATTYFPYRRRPVSPGTLMQTASAQTHVLVAADFELLLATAAITPTDQDAVAKLLQAAVYHAASLTLLERLQISPAQLVTHVSQNILPSFTWNEIWYNALNVAAEQQAGAISITHLLGAWLLHPGMQTYLREQGLRTDDILFGLWWIGAHRANIRQAKRWWSKEKLVSASGLGMSWAAGYTPLVDRFGYIPPGNVWDVPYGHEQEVESLIVSLARRRQSNVILTGPAGSGRLGVIKALAQRVADQQAHPALKGQRVIYVHIGQLLGLASSVPQQMEVISRILDEMERAGNVIAVLDGLGSLLGAPDAGNTMSDILVPFFASQAVRVVVVMSSAEYHLRLTTNEEIANLFEVVQVEALPPDITLQLMALVMPTWEKQRQVFVPYQSMREVVDVTESIMPQNPFPEKAFDILDELTVMAQANKRPLITVKDVQALLTHKVGVPVGKVSGQEAENLLNLEDVIHRRVINQEIAVSAVTKAMIRARAGVRNIERPIGTFLFLGPTGVGKTETAKALAEAYFGAEEYLVRLDMSEYQTAASIDRLLGTVSRPTGMLTSAIADHPFSVILLDEFEKADRSIQQIFLQVFDDARLTDARGYTYSFKHTIIIATSNAGAEMIRSTLAEQGTLPPHFDNDLREHILSQDIFRPELLNRFDGVITFTPLSPEHISQVTRLMLRKLNKRLDREHGITIAVTDELVNFLISTGYDAQFGARPMARAIQNTVEYAVAEQVLLNQTRPGQAITLNIDQLKALVK